MPPRNLPFPPMEAELIEELPDPDGWQYEPKWDGLNAGETMFPPRPPFFADATQSSRCEAPAGRAACADKRLLPCR
jgi:hypothetical protein